MRYCCSISMKILGNQYPEIFSVRRSTPVEQTSSIGWTQPHPQPQPGWTSRVG